MPRYHASPSKPTGGHGHVSHGTNVTTTSARYHVAAGAGPGPEPPGPARGHAIIRTRARRRARAAGCPRAGRHRAVAMARRPLRDAGSGGSRVRAVRPGPPESRDHGSHSHRRHRRLGFKPGVPSHEEPPAPGPGVTVPAETPSRAQDSESLRPAPPRQDRHSEPPAPSWTVQVPATVTSERRVRATQAGGASEPRPESRVTPRRPRARGPVAGQKRCAHSNSSVTATVTVPVFVLPVRLTSAASAPGRGKAP